MSLACICDHIPRRLVRIAYFDHAGSASLEQEPLAVTSSILIHGDDQWREIETLRKRILAQDEWGLTSEEREHFEFHAKDIFWSGKPPFERWTKDKRHRLLTAFLNIIAVYALPIFYGALDRAKYRDALASLYNDAPADVVAEEQVSAFVTCVRNINFWLHCNASDEVALCIVDETREAMTNIKQSLLKRRTLSESISGVSQFKHIVDTAYFGKSNESFGLELADSCSFFLKRHLMGKTDPDSEYFYTLLRPFIQRDPFGVDWAAAFVWNDV